MELFNEEYGILKNNRRTLRAIVNGRLFYVEQEKPTWGNAYYSVFHVKTGNPYGTSVRKVWFTSRERVGDANSIIGVKKLIRDRMANYPEEFAEKKNGSRASCPVAALPAGDNSDFWPTPKDLAGKMLSRINWKKVKFILEPSAGKGDLVLAVQQMVNSRKYYDKHGLCYELQNSPLRCFDVIEADYNLRLMLRGMNLRLIDDDFLHFTTEKRYDLILMNPPFSEGAKHLIKAIQLQKRGGQICCLLNAETIRNPYTNERKLLQRLLAEYNARIEFIKDSFRHAERKSGVEVAIVYMDIKEQSRPSMFFENAEKAAKIDAESQRGNMQYLVVSDEVEAMIQRYNAEVKAGVDFLLAYRDLVPYIMEGTEKYSSPLISVSVNDHKTRDVGNELINMYAEQVRYKYWAEFLNRPSLRKKMTSQIADDYANKVRNMAEFEFSRHNICQVLYDIQSQLVSGVEDSIMKLFDTLTQHSMDNEKNVHYYSGWKTNKAWKVGDRAIIPGYGCFSSYSWEVGKLNESGVFSLLDDLEKSLHYLEKGEPITHWDLAGEIRNANNNGRTKLDLTYFEVKLYKQGTAHIHFNPEAMPLIERLNIFAARSRGWLPPSYGKKRYQDMDAEEKVVIDDFQGEESYFRVMADPSRYLIEKESLRPLLTA